MITKAQTNSSASTKHYSLLLLLFIFSSLLSLLAFKASQLFEQQQQQGRFSQHVTQQTLRTQADLNLILETIQAQAAYVGALTLIRDKSFQTYAQTMLKQTGIVNVVWVEKVAHLARNVHEKTLQSQGFKDFRLIQTDTAGNYVNATRRDEYYALDYIAATDADLPAGLDMGSQTDWKTALLQARDTGTPVLVNPQATTRLEIFQPVYHYGLPEKIAARRANLRGFIFVKLSLSDLFSPMRKALQAQNIQFELKPISSPNSHVPNNFESGSFLTQLWYALIQKTDVNQAILQSTELSLAQAHWQVQFNLEQNKQRYTSWLILTAGLLFSILIVLYVLSLMRRTQQIEILVEKRTTELKESEAQLVQSEKMASIGQMVAGIVHEMNTPLAYVRSSLEITQTNLSDVNEVIKSYETVLDKIEDQAPEDSLQASLEVAQEQRELLEDEESLNESQAMISNGLEGLDKISSLVMNLKNFSRLDRAEYSKHDLNTGLDEALSMVKHMLPVRIDVDKDYGEIPSINCAPAQVNQVLLNFLANAIHAMEMVTDREATLKLSTKLVKSMVEVHIEDNGEGMSPEQMAKIYQPFFTTKRSGQGTGLGLAISKKIMQEHKGHVEVDSILGQGTHFILYFPENLPNEQEG